MTLNRKDVARVAMERMRLPFSGHKFLLAHDLAAALTSGSGVSEVREAYMEWLAALRLESEVLEALVPLAICGKAAGLLQSDVQKAIARPSILSQKYLSDIYGTSFDLPSGVLSHSGPVTSLKRRSSLDELLSKRYVPGVFASRCRWLSELTGYDFIERWAFEFEQLCDVYPCSNGYLEYFAGLERSHITANAITRLGQIARSAYLRTLAFAVEWLGMPASHALTHAGIAGAFDRFYLPMRPGVAPAWARVLDEVSPSENLNGSEVVRWADEALATLTDEVILHFNGPICRTETLAVEFEVVAVVWRGGVISAGDIFEFLDEHRSISDLERAPDGALCVMPISHSSAVEFDRGLLSRALLPTFNGEGMALHMEFVHREPMVVASYASDTSLIARPHQGGASIELSGRRVGALHHWNRAWRPTFPHGAGPGCVVATTLSKQAARVVLVAGDGQLLRLWRVRTLKRESSHQEWVVTVEVGFCGTLES